MRRVLMFLLLTASFPLFSQTDTTIQKIEIATVTAYRADLRAPVTFKNIDKQEIDKVNMGQEPTAILNYTPSVTATSDGGNFFGYSSFRIRGIDQTRVNVTLDGIPLNEPEDQGLYFNNYPDFFNSVSSIQIQRGVGTSSNGVSAFGGSINMTSADIFAPKSLGGGFGYGSFGTGRIYAEYNTGKSEKGYGAYVRVSSIATDGFVDNASHFGKSAFYGVGRQWGDNTLKLVGFIGNQENGMAWLGATQEMLNESPTTNGNTIDEDDNFTNSLTSLQYTKLTGNTRVNATAYYSYLNGNYDINLRNFGIEASQNIALLHHYYGGLVNVTHYLDKFQVTYGVHGNQFDRRHTGSSDIPNAEAETDSDTPESEIDSGTPETEIDSNIPESEIDSGTPETEIDSNILPPPFRNYVNTGNRQTFSGFAKASYEIGKLRLYGDIQQRLTSFTYEGNQEMPTQDWAFLNYRGGANYEINKRYSVYYSYGKTSREPTRNDLFMGNDNLDLSLYNGGIFQEITPETVQDHELGIKFNSGKLDFQINGYFMGFENEITLLGAIGPNGLQLSGNVDNSYRSGVELDLGYKATERLKFTAQLTQSQNRITQDDVEFNHVLTPNTIANASVEYDIKDFTLGMSTKYQGEAYLDLANTEQIDGFSLLNLRATYHAESTIDFSLFLNNVTNQVYNASGYTVDYGDGGVSADEVRYFRQAGFNAFVSISVKI